MATDFASVKLEPQFLIWLKIEAARKSMPIYELLESLVSRGGKKPWKAAI